jgi:hypothetical protein
MAAGDGRTGQCSVRCHVILFVRVGAGRPLEALSSCGTGQSGAPLTICSDFCRVYCAALFTVRVDRCTQIDVAPLVPPDSPVNYSGAAPGKPEAEEFELVYPGALSGVPHQGALRFPFCSFLLKPNLFFLLVCVEPLAPVDCMIYNKLVSPIICVGHFDHQNYLGKCLTLFPFQLLSGLRHQPP